VREAAGYRVVATDDQLPLLGREALHRVAAGDLRGARQWLDWARELSPEPSGDAAGPAFSVLWTRGAPGDEAQARCAAAALTVTDFPEQALPVLKGCREAERDEPRQVALGSALALAFGKAGRQEEFAAEARRVVAARPQAEEPFALACVALMRLQRPDALRDLARQRLEHLPGDRPAQRILVYLDEQRGDLAGAESRLRQLAAAGDAAAEDLNSLAWLLLVEGRAAGEALDAAHRAAQRQKSHGVLHTLAALLAESDKPSEAYQAMLQALDAGEDHAPAAVDWYVFGRLAERYGVPDEARTLYARVSPPEDSPEPESISTYALARRRLAALAATAPAGKP
jgi:tetratricopeptide (TPR) repeat protein